MPKPSHTPSSASRESESGSVPGFLMLGLHFLWIAGTVVLWLQGVRDINANPGTFSFTMLAAVIAQLLALLAAFGYFSLQPNEARVQILFGNYRGTVRRSGFHWANPFYSRSRGGEPAKPAGEGGRGWAQKDLARLGAAAAAAAAARSTKLSLRAHNFNSDTLKVNDKRGNPVEIAAVVVWRVEDTAQAVFDVEDYKSYVQVQSEAAIRGIASRFAYDHGERQEPTLRDSAEEVTQALQEELQARLAKAGVVVDEARLTHLAYAPEIASVMLRRQQAEAIVAARQQIVQGAVGMVHTALRELDSQRMVELDAERRAAMVSNLLVVLCGNADATPVINTGTLYT